MRVVLDTNILLSSLLVRGTSPDRIFAAWRHGQFELASCERQMEEINRVSRRQFFRDRLRAAEVGRMINDLRRLAVMGGPLPALTVSPDPEDNYLLALAEVTRADFLVTGDKSGLLSLKKHGRTAIVSARKFLDIISK